MLGTCEVKLSHKGELDVAKLVSIIIPCYNHEQYIDGCIQSLINQTYRDIEVLICDDHSLDGSFEKLLEWKTLLEERFVRVEIDRNESNLGVCRTLNRLIRKAHGTYIKTLASDDILLSEAISDYVDFAENSGCDVIFSNALLMEEEERNPFDHLEGRKVYYETLPRSGKDLTGILFMGNYILGAALFFRSSTFDCYGLFDEQFLYEDWEYCLRVSTNSGIAYLDKPTVLYRVSAKSLSHYVVNEAGKAKFRRFYSDKLRILDSYKTYTSEDQQSFYMNDSLRTALSMDDRVLAKEILQDMRHRKIPVNSGSMLRIGLHYLGMYGILRMAKRYLRK